MRKPQADQGLVNSMFQAVEASDVNASVTLGVLVEDYDFDRAHRSINLPDQEGQNVNAVDPLDLYLHSVYHNGRESLAFFLAPGAITGLFLLSLGHKIWSSCRNRQACGLL